MELSEAHGFPLHGIVHVPENGAPGSDTFARWLDAGYEGPLDYMRQSRDVRVNLRSRIPWARSILALGAFHDAAPRGQPGRDLAAHVARYARGRDYHRILEKRLMNLALALRKAGVCSSTRWFVDTGPLLERAWAEAAGLGWIGKNGCVIHPKLGSYLMLAEIVMDSEPEADPPAAPHCGTCRRCLDACPTRAFVAPGVLDASRCIVTWNIEQRNLAPETTWAEQGEWVAGCDICQAVCPFNAPRRSALPDADFAAPLPWQTMTLAECIAMDAATFDRAFPTSALRRTGLKGMRLGAITVAANIKAEACREAIEQCRHDPDPDVRARAEWALVKFTE